MNKFLNMQIIECVAWLDGGTFTIKARLENKRIVLIEFVQNMMIEITHDGKYAGQLYLDNTHVEPRSDVEREVIEGVKKVLYGRGGMPWMDKAVLGEKIEYLESDKYLIDFAKMNSSH